MKFSKFKNVRCALETIWLTAMAVGCSQHSQPRTISPAQPSDRSVIAALSIPESLKPDIEKFKTASANNIGKFSAELKCVEVTSLSPILFDVGASEWILKFNAASSLDNKSCFVRVFIEIDPATTHFDEFIFQDDLSHNVRTLFTSTSGNVLGSYLSVTISKSYAMKPVNTLTNQNSAVIMTEVKFKRMNSAGDSSFTDVKLKCSDNTSAVLTTQDQAISAISTSETVGSTSEITKEQLDGGIHCWVSAKGVSSNKAYSTNSFGFTLKTGTNGTYTNGNAYTLDTSASGEAIQNANVSIEVSYNDSVCGAGKVQDINGTGCITIGSGTAQAPAGWNELHKLVDDNKDTVSGDIGMILVNAVLRGEPSRVVFSLNDNDHSFKFAMSGDNQGDDLSLKSWMKTFSIKKVEFGDQLVSKSFDGNCQVITISVNGYATEENLELDVCKVGTNTPKIKTITQKFPSNGDGVTILRKEITNYQMPTQ